VEKLIIADIATKYYAPHHDDILAGLNAVDFSKKPGRDDVDAIIAAHVPDLGTRQFLMKRLHWKEPGPLAFRCQLEAFNRNTEQIGQAVPDEAVYARPTLVLKGEKSRYIDAIDYPQMKRHFPNFEIVIIKNAGHWLHAENPDDFYDAVISFLN